jgi:hypothetical protein
MLKIGFVYFDNIHVIPHFIGSVAELYKDPQCKVDILAPDIEHDYLEHLLSLHNVPKDIIIKLPTYLYKRIAYKIQGRIKPSNQYIFRKNKNKFFEYDVLVFNVFNHTHIKRIGRNHPKFVFLMHGAGDRDYPFTEEYRPFIEKFDLITTAGQKINDLFATMGEFEYTKFITCGYQKLDMIGLKSANKLFDNNKPTVLYNPHFKRELTSFMKYGLDILEYFYQHKEYNLIFAPHMNLFSKKLKKPLPETMIPQKYKDAENMLIDFGSVNSVDMTYTAYADIYLGDVSSQIYEFLIQETKPAIFINAHNFDWQNDKHFQNWHLGKVIENVENLGKILNSRNVWQKDFEEKQKKAIAYTFDIDPNKSSSKRVAEAIINLGKQIK